MAEISAEIRDQLERAKNAWMCTLRPDGSPHLTPVWFVYRADVWWIGSGRRNVKVRNVVADPRVSLALEDGGAPVVAEGIARVHDRDFPEDIVAAFAEKYDGWDVTAVVQPGGDRVLLEISVGRWLLAGAAQ